MSTFTKLKGSLLYKYIVSITIPIIIISIMFSAMLFIVSYKIVDKLVLTQFESSLEVISENIFESLDKNNVKAADDGNRSEYEKLAEQLYNARNSFHIESVYILSRTGGKERIVASNTKNRFQQPYTFNSTMHATLDTGRTQISDIYKDEFGIHKSIFIPFKNTDILLGLDMDASFISTMQSKIVKICIIMTIIFMLAGVIIAYYIGKGIVKPIKHMIGYVERVAKGDLSVEPLPVKGNNEISQLSKGIQNMTADIRTLIQQIAENAEQVAAMSEELTASSEQTSASIKQITSSMLEVADGAEKQNTSFEEVENHIMMIAKKMSDVVESVNDVTAKAFSASTIAEKGNTTMQSATEKMEITSEAIHKTSDVVKRLSTYTNEIGDIVSLINEITDQTNLLALNASIEAARAGEHGKGFAVVAEEVRKLADQSLTATNNIRSRIDTIKEESSQAVNSMTISSNNLVESSTTFNESGEAFREIYSYVTELTQEMNHVNSLIRNMNEGVSGITNSVEQVGIVAVQTSGNIQDVATASKEQSASIEEITASSNNLAEMAQHLRNITQNFKL